MLTRCPSCATNFRVTPEQLKARAGRVRCGECQNVFNALDTLIEEPLAVSAPTAEIGVAPAPTVDELADWPPDAQESFSSALTAVPAAEASAALTALDAKTAAASPAAESAAIATDADQEADWSADFPEPQPASRRWPWAVGTILCVLFLLVQFTYHFRADIAVLEYSPETYSHIHKRGVIGQAAAEVANLFGAYVLKPCLLGFCSILECNLPFPMNIRFLSIEASDLHPDDTHKGRLVLAATLKNRAPFAQQYPHLELTLTDTADKAIARKVLAPADYLPPKSSSAGGMPPNADIAVIVGVDSGELAASGYRLYVFYP